MKRTMVAVLVFAFAFAFPVFGEQVWGVSTWAASRTDELLYGLNYADVKGVGKTGQGSLEDSWPIGKTLRLGVRGSYLYASQEGIGSSNAYTGGVLAGFDFGQIFVEGVGDYFVKKFDKDLNDIAPRYMYGVGVGLKVFDQKSLVKIRVGVDRLEGTIAEYYDRLTVGVAIGRRP